MSTDRDLTEVAEQIATTIAQDSLADIDALTLSEVAVEHGLDDPTDAEIQKLAGLVASRRVIVRSRPQHRTIDVTLSEKEAEQILRGIDIPGGSSLRTRIRVQLDAVRRTQNRLGTTKGVAR